MIKKNITFLLFFITSLTCFSQSYLTDSDFTDSVFAEKKEIYFTFKISSRQEINTLTNVISIDKVTKDNIVFAYSNKKEFAEFLRLSYKFRLLTHPGEINISPKMSDTGIKGAWNAYPTYSAYEAMMYKFAADYPSLCKITDIFTLASGRKILFAKISDNVNFRESEPQFLYTSSIHGDETSGFVHLLHLIDTLLAGYGSNPRITDLLSNMEIWINPLANPDGTFNASGGTSIAGATRGNINAVDLNRNFPDAVGGQHPDGNQWQPETRAFMQFADTMNFVMSANFHEGAEVCNYPWDNKPARAADDDWWKFVSRQYADTAKAFGPPGYFTDITPSGISNGYDWYQIFGGRQDYMNYFKHCREETIEFSETKSPPASKLPLLWEANRRSLFNYMEQALYGIQGVITDSCTGKPMRAKVFIADHDIDSSEVYSALPHGNYYRPVFAGDYNLIFSATGWQSKSVNNISVCNAAAVTENAVIGKAFPFVDFTANTTTVCDDTIFFTDLSRGADSWLWDFGDGTTSTLQNPSHYYTWGGTYTVSLTVANCAGTNAVTRGNFITVIPFSVFPNPFRESVSVVFTSESQATASYQIAGVQGNIIRTGILYPHPGQNRVEITLASCRQGIYFITIKTSGSNYFAKIVKL